MFCADAALPDSRERLPLPYPGGGEAVREFIVAMGRSRRHLPFVWAGAESTEYVTAMGSTVERKA